MNKKIILMSMIGILSIIFVVGCVNNSPGVYTRDERSKCIDYCSVVHPYPETDLTKFETIGGIDYCLCTSTQEIPALIIERIKISDINCYDNKYGYTKC